MPACQQQAGATLRKMNDEELNRLLRTARQEVELPPSFQRDVWKAVTADVAQHEARWGWLHTMLSWFGKPLLAATAWSLALLAGLALGLAVPKSPSSSANVAAYAQFINPLTKSSSE